MAGNFIQITFSLSGATEAFFFRMIEESHQYLEAQGLLQLVARHNKGGRQLEKKMEEVFGNVKQIAKKSGYRIYVSEKVN